jgi:hypothetical protein
MGVPSMISTHMGKRTMLQRMHQPELLNFFVAWAHDFNTHMGGTPMLQRIKLSASAGISLSHGRTVHDFNTYGKEEQIQRMKLSVSAGISL